MGLDGQSPSAGSGDLCHRGQAYASATFWVLAACALSLLCWNVLWEPQRLGSWPDDWDFFFQAYEAVRISIVEYHQFPWWNIWSCGGVPLFANPQVGVFSLHTAFVLCFGTVLGLKLSLAAHMALGFEGCRRLLRRYVAPPFAIFGATVFVSCGGLAMHMAAGHFNTTVVHYLPWLLYFALSLPRGRVYGWLFGGTMAIMALETIDYFAVFQGCIAAIAAVCVLVKAGERRAEVARRILVAAGVFFLVAGFRVGVAARYVQQFSMSAQEPVAVLGRVLPRAFLSPIAQWQLPTLGGGRPWWEYGCYMGLPVVGLFLLSMVAGLRFWHVGAGLCLIAASNITDPWSPSYWLSMVPIFRAMRVLPRWRIPAAFFIAVGSAAGACMLWERVRRPALRAAVVGVCVAGVISMLNVSYRTTSLCLLGPMAPDVTRWAERAEGFYHVGPGPDENRPFRAMFPATRLNRGVVEGYEPLLGYERLRPNAVRSRGEHGYFGEASVDGEQVSPTYWSPNRLVFQDLRGPLRLNLAPGSYWHVNGRQPFAGLRVTEMAQPFAVYPDAAGRVVLTTHPSGWPLGAALALFGLAAVGTGWACGLGPRRRRLESDPQECNDEG